MAMSTLNVHDLVDRVVDYVSHANRTHLLAGSVATLISLNWLKNKLFRSKVDVNQGMCAERNEEWGIISFTLDA